MEVPEGVRVCVLLEEVEEGEERVYGVKGKNADRRETQGKGERRKVRPLQGKQEGKRK